MYPCSHAEPAPPQLASLVCSSTQAPAQSVKRGFADRTVGRRGIARPRAWHRVAVLLPTTEPRWRTSHPEDDLRGPGNAPRGTSRPTMPRSRRRRPGQSRRGVCGSLHEEGVDGEARPSIGGPRVLSQRNSRSDPYLGHRTDGPLGRAHLAPDAAVPPGTVVDRAVGRSVACDVLGPHGWPCTSDERPARPGIRSGVVQSTGVPARGSRAWRAQLRPATQQRVGRVGIMASRREARLRR